MFERKRSWNQRQKLFEPAKRSRDERRSATNDPAFCGGRCEISQLGLAKIRQDGNGANFLPRIVGVNGLLYGRIADHTTTRSVNEVVGNPDLKGSKPERAL